MQLLFDLCYVLCPLSLYILCFARCGFLRCLYTRAENTNCSIKCISEKISVSKVAGGNYFSVGLLGSSTEFRAHSSDIRLRQSWKDNRWVVIHKDYRKCNEGAMHRTYKEGKFICDMPMPHFVERSYALDRHYTIEEDNALVVFPQNLTKCTKKRPRVCSPPSIHAHELMERWKAIAKEKRCQRLVAQHSPRSLEKVDVVASPQIMLGEKYMHASLNNRTTGFFETWRGDAITNVDDNLHFSPSLDCSDTEKYLVICWYL